MGGPVKFGVVYWWRFKLLLNKAVRVAGAGLGNGVGLLMGEACELPRTTADDCEGACTVEGCVGACLEIGVVSQFGVGVEE